MNVTETRVRTENASTHPGPTSVSVPLASRPLPPRQSVEVKNTHATTHTYTYTDTHPVHTHANKHTHTPTDTNAGA